MIRFTPPIRFIAIILTLWVGLRVIFWTPVQMPASFLQSPPFLPDLLVLPSSDKEEMPFESPVLAPGTVSRSSVLRDRFARTMRMVSINSHDSSAPVPVSPTDCALRCIGMRLFAPMPSLSLPQPERSEAPNTTPASPSRLRFSTWALWRLDGISALAGNGELGGNQAGTRALYGLTPGSKLALALAARLSRPIEGDDGAEAALGIALRPVGSVPIELTLERRIALETGGRDAWSLGVAGGVHGQRLPFGLKLDGYAQAGIVGVDQRDLYGDAALAVSHAMPLAERSTLSLGAGVWAGAQPGVSRVDIGPEASLRLRIGDVGVRLAVGWRQRIAGSAMPGSGPALTLGADF